MEEDEPVRPETPAEIKGGLWPMIHTERADLVEDLEALPAERWETVSLCRGLTVREILAHLTSTARMNTAQWAVAFVRSGFDRDRQISMALQECLGADTGETLELFRETVSSTVKPVLPAAAVLGEVLVHGEDIRRPLGIRREGSVVAATEAARYYHRTDVLPVVGRRTTGLRLIATDGPFNGGSGQEVAGRTLALLMAMAGRSCYCTELEGDGVGLLRERCQSGAAY